MDVFSQLYRFKIIPFLKRWRLLNIILGGIDILVIALAFQCAYLMNYYFIGGLFIFQWKLLRLFFLIMPFWLLILYLIQVTEIPRTKRFRVLFFEYLQATMYIVILLLVFYFVFRLFDISRRFLVEFAFLGFVFLFLARYFEYKVFRNYRSKGYNFIRVVLIADDSSVPFIESLINTTMWGYKITHVFSSSQIIRDRYRSSFEILPEKSVKLLYDLMELQPVDEVLYVKANVVTQEVRTIIRSCEELGVVFNLMHNEPGPSLTNAINTTIGSFKFLTFINVPYKPAALALKKVSDIFVSVLLLAILSPVMLAITLSIVSTSRGPVIFKQPRVGLRGQIFNMYKFRTMIREAENLQEAMELKNEVDGPVFKIREDPRVTKVGKFLRKTGLDELPQLINVLKGEMTLIGPRPPLEKEVEKYKRWQLRRLSVKPGLSCFWQVKPERNSIKFDKWMEMDLAYIDNWSLRLDFMIFIRTIKTVFQRSGL